MSNKTEMTKEECFDVNVPEQKISQVAIGGGSSEKYFDDSELTNAKTIVVSIPSQETPKTAEDLQTIYAMIATSTVDVYAE